MLQGEGHPPNKTRDQATLNQYITAKRKAVARKIKAHSVLSTVWRNWWKQFVGKDRARAMLVERVCAMLPPKELQSGLGGAHGSKAFSGGS